MKPAQPDGVVEFQPRSGLPNVLHKLRGTDPVRISYFGGSITQSDPGWRVQTQEWLQKTYPTAPLEMNMAAIAGTGSTLGVFRLEPDVLAHQPDLVFVEFAVNDIGADSRQTRWAMEGIVRRIRRQRPTCDVCFVYTLSSEMTAELRAGRIPASTLLHEEVAAHYGIPSIHLGLEVVRLEGEKKLVFTADGEEKIRLEAEGKIVFARDTCHPVVEGHRLYTEAVQRAFGALSHHAGKPGPIPLPPPLDPGNWESAQMLPILPEQAVGGCHPLAPADWPPIAWSVERWSSLWKAAAPGAGVTVRFRGTGLGIFDVVGPDSGALALTIDGRPDRTVVRFDQHCQYFRRHYFMAVHSLPEGEHEVCLKLMPEPPDKAAIMGRPLDGEQAALYVNQVWYPAALMVLGNLVQR
jgi:lysophospholipase L1-like esterase